MPLRADGFTQHQPGCLPSSVPAAWYPVLSTHRLGTRVSFLQSCKANSHITVPHPPLSNLSISQGNNTSSSGSLGGDMEPGTAWGSVRVGHFPTSFSTRPEGSVVSTGRSCSLSQALCLPPFEQRVCHSGLGSGNPVCPGLWARSVLAPLDTVTR